MEHLDLNVLEVMQVLEDALIVDAAVQWVTMGLFVGVVAISTAVVVKRGVFVQPFNSSVLSSVRDGHHYIHVKALTIALGNEEPVWQAKPALKFLNVELLALV